jgi:hypothetical protein
VSPKNDGPLAGLDSAIDRVAAGSRPPVMSDAKPREHAIVRDEHGRLIHVRRHPDGRITGTLVGHE